MAIKKESTYTVSVRCSNCDFGKFIPKDMAIKKGRVVSLTTCPECGCKTLVKKL